MLHDCREDLYCSSYPCYITHQHMFPSFTSHTHCLDISNKVDTSPLIWWNKSRRILNFPSDNNYTCPKSTDKVLTFLSTTFPLNVDTYFFISHAIEFWNRRTSSLMSSENINIIKVNVKSISQSMELSSCFFLLLPKCKNRVSHLTSSQMCFLTCHPLRILYHFPLRNNTISFLQIK